MVKSGEVGRRGLRWLKEKGGSNPWKSKYQIKFRKYGRKNASIIPICSTTRKIMKLIATWNRTNHQTKLLHAERTNIQNPVVGRKCLQRCNRKMTHFHVSPKYLFFFQTLGLQLPRRAKWSLHFEAAWEAYVQARGYALAFRAIWLCRTGKVLWMMGMILMEGLGCLSKSVMYQHLEELSSAQKKQRCSLLWNAFLSLGSLRYPPCLSGTYLQVLVTFTSWDHTH